MDKPVRLLIADRNTDFTAILAEILSSDPRVEIVGRAMDGDEAYEMLETYKPDVLLIDIMLPYIDGMAVIRYANQQPPASRPRVLVLSSIFNDGIICEAISQGVQCFIGKPCCMDFLNRRILSDESCERPTAPALDEGH